MLTIHLLGHSYLAKDGKPVNASLKAVALLIYLTLQRRPQHREHLAELMWNTPDALRNLRVELHRLRHLDLDLFPSHQPLLEAALPTDLDRWLREADHLPDSRLGEWLSQGSGLPLSGLEDLGSTEFREWVDSQRWVISQEVEAAFSRVYARSVQNGRLAAAGLIRARADQLGMQLHITPAPSRAMGSVKFERTELTRRFRQLLERARETPQLVILSGRSSEGKRELIQGAVAGSDWQALQMQASPHPELQRAAFLHQLLRLLPPERHAEAHALLAQPGHREEDLVRAWTLVAATGHPLVIAIHDIGQATPFLTTSMQFAMNLPSSLMLVLSPSSADGQHALRDALGTVDRSRLHRLEVPALAVHEVMDAVSERQQLLSPDQRRAYATRVVQQSDGLDLHARELIEADLELPGTRLPLPAGVRDALLGELGPLPPAFRGALARLSLMYGPLDMAVAHVLLGSDAPAVLAQGAALGLLTTAAPEETVRMPGLMYQASDLEDGLCFSSELMRVALAGTLSSSERRELRSLLAVHHLTLQPALARYYATRAGLTDVAAQASAQFPTPLAAPISATATAPARRAADPSQHEPEGVVTSRTECRTSNGYRVATERGHLQILRNGLYAQPPLLRLLWPSVPAGSWDMVARLDVQNSAPELESSETAYAFAVRVGSGPQVVYTQHAACEVQAGQQMGAQVPLGCWFALSGTGDGGPLELSVKSLDIALTIATWRWNELTLLPVQRANSAGQIAGRAAVAG
ncbi:hypothetical protein E7T06_01360 [Deinococcus sp. Arct2-2]|uniref:hypothetical protein n=1 Tax=Deinococcus sp. Arct2-2 TaxID=2568653 RepID=UPI0010A3C17C|nr:hypothetical protein [Deinococcus sp. Arct2-2]THF71631.1 hypothetical protein E7T06_01360 [Deinococcus sp. Arct2-2]